MEEPNVKALLTTEDSNKHETGVNADNFDLMSQEYNKNIHRDSSIKRDFNAKIAEIRE